MFYILGNLEKSGYFKDFRRMFEQRENGMAMSGWQSGDFFESQVPDIADDLPRSVFRVGADQQVSADALDPMEEFDRMDMTAHHIAGEKECSRGNFKTAFL